MQMVFALVVVMATLIGEKFVIPLQVLDVALTANLVAPVSFLWVTNLVTVLLVVIT